MVVTVKFDSPLGLVSELATECLWGNGAMSEGDELKVMKETFISSMLILNLSKNMQDIGTIGTGGLATIMKART